MFVIEDGEKVVERLIADSGAESGYQSDIVLSECAYQQLRGLPGADKLRFQVNEEYGDEVSSAQIVGGGCSRSICFGNYLAMAEATRHVASTMFGKENYNG